MAWEGKLPANLQGAKAKWRLLVFIAMSAILLALCTALLPACDANRPKRPTPSIPTIDPTSIPPCFDESRLSTALPEPTTTISQARNVELVGHIGGQVGPLSVQGDYVYLGLGPQMAVIDVSVRQTPQQVGYIVLPGIIEEIYVRGNYAYVAAREAGLRIIDISNVSVPFEVGFYKTPRPARDVTVAGHYAYVAYSREGDGLYDNGFVQDGGVSIVDISDPTTPSHVSAYRRDDGGVTGLEVADGYLFASYLLCHERKGCTGNLLVLDVSDPLMPVESSYEDLTWGYSTPGNFDGVDTSDITVAGHYAYIADRDYLRVVDISDPANPVQVGINGGYVSCKLPPCRTSAKGVAVAGGYAYIADGYDMRVLDVSDPSRPADVSSYRLERSLHPSLVVAGNYAYGTNWDGLWIVDVSDPANPMGMGVYQATHEDYACGTRAANGYAYLIDFDGLRAVTLSSSAVLSLSTGLGLCSMPSGGGSLVATEGSTLYCSDVDTRLQIVDVSSPQRPRLVGTYGPGIQGVSVAGKYAYVAHRVWDGSQYLGSLHVVDVSNPADPIQVGTCDVAEIGRNVAALDGYVYVTQGRDDILRIIDVSDLHRPLEAGACRMPERVASMQVVQDYAYFLVKFDGLWVSNVHDPAVPVGVGFLKLPGPLPAMAISDRYAYIAAGDAGLRVVDISDPTAMVEVGFYNTPGFALDVTVVDGYVYVADHEGGLFVFRLSSD